jgi:hypothetical protein
MDDLLAWDPGLKARTTDPVTAKLAALANLPLKNTQRWEIFEIHLAYPEGLTDDELSQLTDIRLNSLTTRRSELFEGGWLEDSGLKRKARTGVSQVVWRVTAKTTLAFPSLNLSAQYI